MNAAIIILLSALSGFCLTRILVALLFSPGRPVHIAGFKLQGLIPGQQEKLAEAAGRAATAAFSITAITEKISSPDNFQKLKPELERHVDHFLNHKLKEVFPMLSMFIGEKTINQFRQAFLTELEQIFPQVMAHYTGNLQNELNLEKTITEKIAGLPIEKLQASFMQLAGRQLKKLYLLGAVFGGITGIITAAILYWFS